MGLNMEKINIEAMLLVNLKSYIFINLRISRLQGTLLSNELKFLTLRFTGSNGEANNSISEEPRYCYGSLMIKRYFSFSIELFFSLRISSIFHCTPYKKNHVVAFDKYQFQLSFSFKFNVVHNKAIFET